MHINKLDNPLNIMFLLQSTSKSYSNQFSAYLIAPKKEKKYK